MDIADAIRLNPAPSAVEALDILRFKSESELVDDPEVVEMAELSTVE